MTIKIEEITRSEAERQTKFWLRRKKYYDIVQRIESDLDNGNALEITFDSPREFKNTLNALWKYRKKMNADWRLRQIAVESKIIIMKSINSKT